CDVDGVLNGLLFFFFFFSSRRRHTRSKRDWSSDVCSSDLTGMAHDGIANVPEEGTWLLNKGERVLSPQQNADFTNFMKGQSNTGNNSGGGVIINQNFNIQGNGDAGLKSAIQQAARDGRSEDRRGGRGRGCGGRG